MTNCVHHTASVFEKGGRHRLFDLSGVKMVRWDRRLDQTGDALVTLAPPFGDCASYLKDVLPMRHELVIYADGKRAWEGPITLVEDHPGSFTIAAKDVTFYLNRMVMSQVYSSRINGRSELILDRFRRIILTELERFEDGPLSVNLSDHLRFFRSENEPGTSRRTEAGEKYVYQEMDDLAWRNGVDFGVAGRSIYFMDTDTPIGTVRRLTSDDFASPVEVVFYGAELATIAYVTDRQGRYVGHGPGSDPYYGRVELLHGNYGESDDPATAAAVSLREMQEQAVRDFTPRYPVPMTVRVPQNTGLRHETFLELQDSLFPGVRVPLTASGTVHQVSRLMKLKDLRVEENAERLEAKVTLTPASESTVVGEDAG